MPLFLILFGIIEYGGYIWAQEALQSTATVTARCVGLLLAQRAPISGAPNYETSVCPYASNPPTGTASLYPQGSTILCGCADISGSSTSYDSTNAKNFAVTTAKNQWGVTIVTGDVTVSTTGNCGTTGSVLFSQVNISHAYTPGINFIPLLNNKTISAQACFPMAH